MSSPATRFVLVDDTDSSIQYTGAWFPLDHGKEDNLGRFGPPFLSTLHGVNSSASISYTFNGSQVLLYGSGEQNSESGSWECFVDGFNIGKSSGEEYPGNNRLLCNNASLFDGQHTITLNITISNATFLFDRINYAPSTNVPFGNAYIYVDSSDAAITYSSGWTSPFSFANTTQQPGATMSFGFFGTSLSWYSYASGTNITSSATFTIDGQIPSTFQLTGRPNNFEYNQLFFQTPSLPSGQHFIQVTNGAQSSTNTTALSLDFLIVSNLTAPTPSPTSVSTSSTGLSPSPSPANSNNIRSKSRSSIGGAVGGSIGGVFAVIIIILGVIFLRKRKTVPKLSAFITKPKAQPSDLPSDGMDIPSDA